MELTNRIREAGFRPVAGDALRIDATEPTAFLAENPGTLAVEVAAGCRAQLVVLCGAPTAAELRIVLGTGAALEAAVVFLSEAFAEISVVQEAQSSCRLTTAQFVSSEMRCRIGLEGRGAENELKGFFVAAGTEHCVAEIRTEHRATDCRSDSTVRGVAGGAARGEFRGMVYVAPGAQRTDARQQNRNVLLGEAARIETQPQLEIYADDVKCSHGATVGLLDGEAVLYMRQRGLSENQARSLQIEGFVGEVVSHCGIGPLSGLLTEAVAAKMEKM